MISIPEKKVEEAIQEYQTEIDEFIRKRKGLIDKYKGDRRRKFTDAQKRDLTRLQKNLEAIVKATPNQLKDYKRLFNEIIIPDEKKLSAYRAKKKKRDIKYKNDILKLLGYKTLRSSLYPKYFNELGIKACVYCNSQLAIGAKKEGEDKIIARFQVDHYVSKSAYPYLSISFYNLYPVCASCNLAKGTNDIKFILYSNQKDDTTKSSFAFKLKKGSAGKFLNSRNYDDIEFTFTGDESKTFNDVFAIQGIYDTQKDIVEELILKKKIYTKSYRKVMRREFPALFKSPSSLSNRIIIGNYSFADEIHKRPLAKFTQDIARQLKLIND